MQGFIHKIIGILALYFIFCPWLSPQSVAQSKIYPGSLVDATSNEPILLGSIMNITTGETTISRRNGTFEIKASLGHIIAFQANGYYADTISINAKRMAEGSLLLALKPLPSTLEGVTVASRYSAYQIDSIERRREFLENVGEVRIPAVSRANDLGFGVGINLDRWSRRERGKRKARTIYEIMEEEAYINYRWNEALVSQYVTYTDDELYDFMDRNRPSHAWLRKNTDDESIIYYINQALKKEKKGSNRF